MDLEKILFPSDEKPLDNIVTDGGFMGIFRTVACIGDSLSSGEHECFDEEGNRSCHDYFEYSWGQYIARSAGIKVYNFSRGGMTAKEYCESFAEQNGFWDKDKLCQGYIIALGANDYKNWGGDCPPGSLEDICINDWHKNAKTFTGYYAQIIQRIKEMQPKARIFLVGFPDIDNRNKDREHHTSLLYSLADMFEYTYVLDLYKYGPKYDDNFQRKFFLSGHMNAAGYLLTGKMIESYIDYIIRHILEDFCQIGFVGTPYHSTKAKW